MSNVMRFVTLVNVNMHVSRGAVCMSYDLRKEVVVSSDACTAFAVC